MKNGMEKIFSGEGRRRFLAAVLMLYAMALCLTGCGSSSLKNSKFTGKWMALSYEMSGFTLDGDEDSSLVLNADGKGTLTLMGNPADIKWQEKDSGISIRSGLKSYSLSYSNDTLIMDSDGLKVTFAKEGSAKSTTAAATTAATTAAKKETQTSAAAKKETTAPETAKADKTAQSGGSLMGYWRLSGLTGDNGEKLTDLKDVMGTDTEDPDIKEMGDIMQLEFHDGNSVYYGTMGLGLEGTWTPNGKDGADMKVSDSEYTVKLDGDELLLMEEDQGKTMTYYFKKASGKFDTTNLVSLSDLNGDTGETTGSSDREEDITYGESTDETDKDGVTAAAFDGTIQSAIAGTWVAYDPKDAAKKVVLTLLVYDNAGTGNTYKGYLMTGDARISYFCDVSVESQDSVRVTPTSDTKKEEATYKVDLDNDGKGMTWTFTGGDKTVDMDAFHMEKSS